MDHARAARQPGRRTDRLPLAAGSLVLIAGLAACSAGDDSAGDTNVPTETVSSQPSSAIPAATEVTTSEPQAPTTTATPPPEPKPKSAGDGVPEVETFEVGEKATYDDGSSVQVFTVEQPFVDTSSIIPAPAGKELAEVDVEVCLGSRATTTFGNNSLNAYPASGGPLPSRLSSQFPAFLGSGPTESGECQRGFVTFLADEGTRVAWVVWTQPKWDPVRFRV